MSVVPIAVRTGEEDGPARPLEVVIATGIGRQSEEVSDEVTASSNKSDGCEEEKEERGKRSGGGHWKSKERRVKQVVVIGEVEQRKRGYIEKQ
ncbi:hypothetical protein DEO72_LG7g378 [Vigna unguiculata]|uniref:Uncharacterized protein n=1 Tax=Vigna unguiculata TaxID=3917 RepID=A0A4D6MFK4_VIGUN|nr:hypothetical protein DEO72_LG7g378 [Vigna unguiculata]